MDKFEIDIPSCNIICASQGSGKSSLIRFLMYKMRKEFDYGVVFCNTMFEDDSFEYVPEQFIHPEYDEKVLENLMNLQASLVERGIRKNAYVIFDDCLDSPNEFKSVALKKLSTTLRHYFITLVFSTQYLHALPSRLRSNAMNVFIFHTDNKNMLESIYNSYCQKFQSYNEFRDYIFKETGNYKFIYIKNRMKPIAGQTIEETFPVYRAPAKIPKFKLKYNNKI